MSTLALVMAGGTGERMLASGSRVPKPLVPVLGVPLLERNLWALIRHGIRQIAVLVPSAEGRLREFVEQR